MNGVSLPNYTNYGHVNAIKVAWISCGAEKLEDTPTADTQSSAQRPLLTASPSFNQQMENSRKLRKILAELLLFTNVNKQEKAPKAHQWKMKVQ